MSSSLTEIIDFDPTVSAILDDPINQDFRVRLQRFVEAIADRQFQDVSLVAKEANNMEVDICLKYEQTEDLAKYNDYIDAIQGYRDRIVHLLNEANDDQYFMDSYYDYLVRVWTANFSKKKSKDQREGEAELIMDFCFRLRMERKMLHERLKRIASNLDHKMQAVSRKVSVLIQVGQHLAPNLNVSDPGGKMKFAIEKNTMRIEAEEQGVEKKKIPTDDAWNVVG